MAGENKMNELYISVLYLYFKTDKTTYNEAFRELEDACEKAGIELHGGCDGELRNEEGEPIDKEGE